MFEYEDYQCAECGIKNSQIYFTNDKGWTYQWVRRFPSMNIGYKRWTCQHCLMLLFNGLKSRGIEKR
jgi:hypothetical protein